MGRGGSQRQVVLPAIAADLPSPSDPHAGAVRIELGWEWRNSAGRRHRDDDEPAVIWDNGTHEWWRDGQPHRDGDEPAVIMADGTRQWWRVGQRRPRPLRPDPRPGALRRL